MKKIDNELLELCLEAARIGSSGIMAWLKRPDMTKRAKAGTADDVLSLQSLDEKVQRQVAQFLANSKLGELLAIYGEDLDQPLIGKHARYKVLLDIPDGTQEVVTGNDNWAVLVSVFERGKPLISVCYVPAKDKLYWALRGAGAFVKMGDRTIRLPRTRMFRNFPIITVSLPWGTKQKQQTLAVMEKLAEPGISFRMFGSSGYEAATVAEGRRSAFMQVELKSWEFGVTLLIIESGGQVWSRKTKGDEYAVGASIDPKLHRRLVTTLKRVVH